MNSKQSTRILVLGSTPHSQRISAYTWDQIPEDLNIADFDVVIINLVPFRDKEYATKYIDFLPPWNHFARLLFSDNSEIIVIGLPEIEFKGGFARFMWRLPIRPGYVFATGEEIREIDKDFEFYFQYVKKWFFHATHELELEFRAASRHKWL
jgi:hypothetical protein